MGTTMSSVVSLMSIVLALALGQKDNDKAYQELYVLRLPALSPYNLSDVAATEHLVRVVRDGDRLLVEKMFPDLFRQERFANIEDIVADKVERGLGMRRSAGDTIVVQGAVLSPPAFGSWVDLRGNRDPKGGWHGLGFVYPLGHMANGLPGHYESEWSLEKAPPSAVYDAMLQALRFLRDEVNNDPAGRQTAPYGQPLTTKHDYVGFLGSKDVNWPKHGLVSLGINDHFRSEIAGALEEGRIVLRDGDFVISEQVEVLYSAENSLDQISAEVAAVGFMPGELMEMFRPPLRLEYLRHLAGLPAVERESLLVRAGPEAREFLDGLQCSWEEIGFAPAIVLFAAHMAQVSPEVLQQHYTMAYIGEESRERYFPALSYWEIAAVPAPVLLLACLPKLPAERAEGLAQTERVKRLLDASGLKVEEIPGYTVPGLVYRVLSRVPAEDAQDMVEQTPKFAEYLRTTDFVPLKNLAVEKNLIPVPR